MVVTDDAGARPVRRATLTIAGGGLRGSRETVTDDQGRFAFAGLQAGGYTLSATKAAWLTTYFGSRHPGVQSFGSTPLTLADGEHNTTVVLRLLHGSAITGTILNQAGRPAAVNVRLLQFRMTDGQRTLVPVSGGNADDRTDDRGVYRLYGLTPGEYVVAAMAADQVFGDEAALHQVTPDVLQSALLALDPRAARRSGSEAVSQGPAVGYTNVYFPGTVDLTEAGTVKVGPDDEKSGIDFPLQLVPTAQVSGTVVSPDGQPPARAQVSLVLLGQADDLALGPLAGAVFALTQPDGTFRVSPVAPGRYALLARAADRPGASAVMAGAVGPAGRGGGAPPLMLWAQQDVTVSGRDLSGVTLNLQAGMTVSGHVVSDVAGPAPIDFTRVVVSVTPADKGLAMARVAPAGVEADGTFRLSGVVPGRYRLSAMMGANGRRAGGAPSAVSDWKVASAVIGGHDALDLPFTVSPGEAVPDATITLTRALGEISGTLSDAAGQPAHDYVVVVFAADHRAPHAAADGHATRWHIPHLESSGWRLLRSRRDRHRSRHAPRSCRA
jgi:5-hydroxyisourate hydrolase-like protein (transthyretin family)